MRNAWTIMRKELRIYFTTWVAYVFWAVFVIYSAYFFLMALSQFQNLSLQFMQLSASQYLQYLNVTDAVLVPLMSVIPVMFIFAAPILTARLLAGERSSRTLELILTLPVRTLDFVVGKYLAVCVVVVIAYLLLLVFPIMLDQYGTTASGESAVDWYTVGAGFVGLVLFAGAAIAIGLFWSSLTESPVVAGFASWITTVMLYILSGKALGLTGIWAEVITAVSMSAHLQGFMRGVLRLEDVVYFLSFIVLGIFLSHRMLEARRWK